MNKADKQETTRRLMQIAEWMLDGESVSRIIQYSSTNWNIGERQVYNYIEKARKRWDEICNKQFESNLSWHLLTRERLYQKCIKKEDYSNARQILDSIADLQGLKEIRIKSEHTEKQEYHLIIERADQEDNNNGNGRYKNQDKVKSLAR